MRKVKVEYGTHKCGELEFYLIDCETGVKIETYDRWCAMTKDCDAQGWEIVEEDASPEPEPDTSEEDRKNLESFQRWLVLICGKHGVELNGNFSIAISSGRDGLPERESDTDVIRNVEHVSKNGVIRTTSRGNRP